MRGIARLVGAMLVAALLSAAPLAAAAPAAAAPAERQNGNDAICLLVEAAARANGLPVEFFARVIWQESRFDADAVGPPTRSGARAQGIAQFMPTTAAERNLLDPFDPVEALPKAAEFLRALRADFGNLGLAAAAYNAGPRRVREWLAGSGGLPAETRAYVAAVTGRSVEQWRNAQDAAGGDEPADCSALTAALRRPPNDFVAALRQRVRNGASRAWGVQLAASFSRAQALAAYARTLRRFAALLRGRDPLILPRLLRSRGTRPMYQVRVGADTRAEANRLCSRLRAQGGACLVLRNE